MIVYGLKSCDSCRKALKELKEAGFSPALHDLRDDPLSIEKINVFREAFGEALVNRRSTTWRGLSDEQRARTFADLLGEYPALMKRPVIESSENLTLGWDDATRATWGLTEKT